MDSNFVDGLPELPALAENAVDTTVDHLRTVTKRARILGTANDQGPAYTEALQRKAQTIVRVAQSTDPQQAPAQQAQLYDIQQTLETMNDRLQDLQTDMRALKAEALNERSRIFNKEANTDAELALIQTLANGQNQWQVPQAVQDHGSITANGVSGQWTTAMCDAYITAYGPNIGGNLHNKRLWVLRHLGRRRV